MKEYVSYEQTDGSAIVVEVDEGDHERGVSRAARRSDGLVVDSGKKFEEMIKAVRPVASTIVGELRSGDRSPDTITVQFGLKLTFSAGAVIASSSGEGTFQITLTWEKPKPDAVQQPAASSEPTDSEPTESGPGGS